MPNETWRPPRAADRRPGQPGPSVPRSSASSSPKGASSRAKANRPSPTGPSRIPVRAYSARPAGSRGKRPAATRRGSVWSSRVPTGTLAETREDAPSPPPVSPSPPRCTCEVGRNLTGSSRSCSGGGTGRGRRHGPGAVDAVRRHRRHRGAPLSDPDVRRARAAGARLERTGATDPRPLGWVRPHRPGRSVTRRAGGYWCSPVVYASWSMGRWPGRLPTPRTRDTSQTTQKAYDIAPYAPVFS